MDNDRENLRVKINEAATELSRISPYIQFEDAQWLIKSFIQYQSLPPGHPRLVIGDESVQSIRVDHIPKSLTFLDAAESAFALYEISASAAENLFLSILGGLFLIRALRRLSTVTLSPVDSLMIMALLRSKRDEGYTPEEWLSKIRKEEKYNIKVSEDFGLSHLNERAEVLEGLKAIELLDGKWRISDQVKFL